MIPLNNCFFLHNLYLLIIYFNSQLNFKYHLKFDFLVKIFTLKKSLLILICNIIKNVGNNLKQKLFEESSDWLNKAINVDMSHKETNIAVVCDSLHTDLR